MSCRQVDINGETYIRADLASAAEDTDGRPYVIVRCRDAGVHAGYLVRKDEANGIAELTRSRRLWRWHGRTLTGLAIEGTDDPNRCKFGDPIDNTLRGWVEIMPCSERARESLQSVETWKND